MNTTTEIYKAEIFNEYLLLKGLAANTRDKIRKQLVRFTAWAEKENIELTQISYNDILVYLNHCKKQGNQQCTLQIYTLAIKHYYDFLMHEQEVTENPCSNVDIKGIKRRTLYETFSQEELDDIYRNYKTENPLVHKRNKIMLGLIIYQALRSKELASLTVQDIKVREGKIFIAGSRRTAERELSLEAHQVFDLMDYINETRKLFLAIRGQESKCLFLSIGKSERVANLMHKLCGHLYKQNSRIKEIKQIRASVITNWLKAHNIRKVQYMAGHKYISSTEAYKVNNMDDLKEDINRYHPDL